jgi:hypothetical protein
MRRTISARFLGCRRLASASLRGGLIAAASLLIAGCGYFSGGSHPMLSAHRKSAPQTGKALDPAARALAGMVEAVGPSGSQPPIELRFSIRDRPQVGVDDEIDYAVIPQVAGLETVRLAFHSFEGLHVAAEGPSLAAIKPALGVPLFGSITVRPLKSGLFTLTVAVAVDSPNGDVVWTFNIPVIAGDGPAQTAAARP